MEIIFILRHEIELIISEYDCQFRESAIFKEKFFIFFLFPFFKLDMDLKLLQKKTRRDS